MALQQINVANKVATHLKRCGAVVCGNTDYEVEFVFDSEWDAHETKTARFVYNGRFIDVEFQGTTCPMPAVHRAEVVHVGVYAGDLCTTTPAAIPCQKSILCGSNDPHEENEANYASEAQQAAKDAQEAAETAQEAADLVTDTLGDMDAALDAILAIQEELIGGDNA